MSGLSPIDYERTQPRRRLGVRFIYLLPITGILALLLALLLPTMHRRPHDESRLRCNSHLRQIGQAILLYAMDNHGLFPPDLQTLASAEPIGLECFVCQSTADTRARNPGELTLPGHVSYIYVSAGLSIRSRPDAIVALEDPANHGLGESSVLFADGHVESLDLTVVQQILNELNAGHNPPTTLTPSLSKGGAEQDYQKNWKPRMPQLKTGVWRIPTTQPVMPE